MDQKNSQLAFVATLHCLTGCGLGDILGMILGTTLGFPYISRIITGLVLGFVLGFSLGILPMIKANMSFTQATKVVLTTELISIVVMEAAEALTELFFPGMRRTGVIHTRYWIGLFTALLAGFLAAYPVNLWLVKKGIRHHH